MCKCINKGWLIPLPIMARGPLEHFLCGVDPLAVCWKPSLPTVRGTYIFILMGNIGGWGRGGRGAGRRGRMLVGEGGQGGIPGKAEGQRAL